MANTFRKIYKKTGNNGNESDYQLIANVGVNGVDLDLMKGATTETDGELGLVPKPVSGEANRYLASDGTWKTLTYHSNAGIRMNIPATTRVKINSIFVEEGGSYILFFRCRVSGITISSSWTDTCLVQLSINSVENDSVNYLDTEHHFINQEDTFNSYDIAKIEPNTTINFQFYHNVSGYNMTCQYSTMCALRID